GSHKGKQLANSVMKTLDEYGITEKLVSITSDNAGNCDTMLVEIREMLATKGITSKIEDQRIRCLAHIINLACQASLKIL
ncbi:unnamed protein product, partial [Allacma fusca]